MDRIWIFRNQLVHKGIQFMLLEALQQIASKLNFHSMAWLDSSASSLWSPPPHGNIKTNYDVSM
jgi:hypothetical protein